MDKLLQVDSRNMPLTELMHYFNDQLQTQARTKSLPKTGFFKADNQYWGRFGNLILGSHFQGIKSFESESLIGYNSELLVRSSTGNALNIDSIFNSLDSTDQIVHLDRLVRTLHSINYLQQHDGRKDLLSLQVQPRHIISVDSDHGKTFEKILSDCGLGPERVLLHTRLLDEESLPHFLRALSSYRLRDYKIGIHLRNKKDIALLLRLGISPDVILVSHPEVSQQLVAHPLPLSLTASKRILIVNAPVIAADTAINNQSRVQADAYLLNSNTESLSTAIDNTFPDVYLQGGDLTDQSKATAS
ncbi:MAG TPA: hypothetical protein VF433_13145 [Cellvibrio sp.]